VPRKKLEIASLALIAVGVLLLIVSASTVFPWANFDRTREVGPVEYTLQADCDPLGFEYEVRTRSAGGGGIIGGGGIGGNVSKVEPWKTYPQASGEFMDNLGIIYNSNRERDHIYEIIMRNPPNGTVDWPSTQSPSAYLNVSLRSDMIPFWREGGSTGMAVTVTFLGHDLEGLVSGDEMGRFSITVSRVEVRARTRIDPETGAYSGDDIVLFSRQRGWNLKEVNSSFELGFDAKFPSGAQVLGIYAEIEANLTDFWGRPSRASISGNANPINIYPMSTATFLRGMGIPFSGLLILISLLNAGLSVLLLVRKGPAFRIFVLVSGATALLSALWFHSGISAAVDLLGERLTGAEEGLTIGPGLYICAVGALVLIACGVLNIAAVAIDRRKGKDAPAQGTFRVLKE